MPTIKIENKSDDDIIISFCGEEKELADGESTFFENRKKGEYEVHVHRKRVPKESILPEDAPKGLEAAKAQDEKPGSHVQLDADIIFDVNSSKAVVNVIQEVKGVETLHEDVIFVGYNADVSGAKLVEKKDSFANEKIRKSYLFQQLKSAFLPVGLVGIAVFILGAVLLILYAAGVTISVGKNDVTLVRILILFAGGVLVAGYFAVNVKKILKRAKSLSGK